MEAKRQGRLLRVAEIKRSAALAGLRQALARRRSDHEFYLSAQNSLAAKDLEVEGLLERRLGSGALEVHRWAWGWSGVIEGQAKTLKVKSQQAQATSAESAEEAQKAARDFGRALALEGMIARQLRSSTCRRR